MTITEIRYVDSATLEVDVAVDPEAGLGPRPCVVRNAGPPRERFGIADGIEIVAPE